MDQVKRRAGQQSIDMTSYRSGKLKVVGKIGSHNGHTWWLCACDCGGSKEVTGGSLRRGDTKSCGCEWRKQKHGHARTGNRTPEYAAWAHMIERCTNDKCVSWSDYGGRGITVCDRWRESFEAFYADMGPRPSDRHMLDRVDNDGNYQPNNCAWRTRYFQNRNTRRTVMLTHNGKTMCIKDWADHLSVSLGCLRWRLKNGWSVDMALSTPSSGA